MLQQETTLLLHGELIACGLEISGCDSSGAIHFYTPDENNIAPLVSAAHGKSLDSKEALTLQAAISEERWLAYKDARNAFTRELRAIRYKNETDSLFFAIFENAPLTEDSDGYIIKIPATAYKKWVESKAVIRAELAYLE
jgi:hypothetical protein